MNDKEKELELSQNPEDIFAGLFYVYFPRMSLMIDKMSNKMLRRLIKALIEVPLNKKDYNPSDKLEREAFLLGDKLLQAKMMMIIHALQEEHSKVSATQSEMKPAEEKQVEETQSNG